MSSPNWFNLQSALRLLALQRQVCRTQRLLRPGWGSARWAALHMARSSWPRTRSPLSLKSLQGQKKQRRRHRPPRMSRRRPLRRPRRRRLQQQRPLWTRRKCRLRGQPTMRSRPTFSSSSKPRITERVLWFMFYQLAYAWEADNLPCLCCRVPAVARLRAAGLGSPWLWVHVDAFGSLSLA